ncbi:MAG: DUF2975 domain-containing protein [Cyclobacteriaceae bacterium]
MKRLKHTIGLVKFAKWLVLILGIVVLALILFIPKNEKVKISGLYFKVSKELQKEQPIAGQNFNDRLQSSNNSQELFVLHEKLSIEVPMTNYLRGAAFLVLLITLGICYFILENMNQIFQSIQQGQPFSESNTYRLKQIGSIVMLSPILEWALMTASRLWIDATYKFDGLSIDYENELGKGVFLLGLLIYTLAFAFEQGLKIKEENELTV